MLPIPMFAKVLLLGLLFAATPMRAQSGGPHVLLGAGISGQRDNDRDLGTAGITADAGVTWPMGARVRARLSATLFLLPGGQGCACDPGSPPLSVQGAYGVFGAIQSVPQTLPLYVLGGVGLRSGGFDSLNERQTATVLVGAGLAFGPSQRGALEVRFEQFVSRLGATRALVPLTLLWRL